MNLHNFALTPEQEFPLSWASSPTKQATRHEKGVAVSELNLKDLQGAPLASSPAGLAKPAETAVLYSAMTIRGANHNRPVATVNHTSWVVSEPHKPPLLALDRAQWVDAIKQPTTAQKLKVPWIKETGKERWMELVLNNYDDKGHPFHLVSSSVPSPPSGPCKVPNNRSTATTSTLCDRRPRPWASTGATIRLTRSKRMQWLRT